MPHHPTPDSPGHANQPSPERLQIEAMLSEGGGVSTATPDPPGGIPMSPAPKEEMSTAAQSGGWLMRRMQPGLQQLGHRYLLQLARAKGRVSESMTDVVDAVHRRATQSRLALELIDDFKDGTYRHASWLSVAVLAGALLHRVQPRDMLPSFLPAPNWVDDDILFALAVRVARADLISYCKHKGYSTSDIFAS